MNGARESLTLLHLSDPQFGPLQQDPQGHTKGDRLHDTLQARLLQDIATITSNDGVPKPELVVVTGDLSEHAKPSQFAAFEAFAGALLDGLELPRERLVLVPGNHDVSWNGCKAYFEQCAAGETEPEPPYWPKWLAYAEMLSRWYGKRSPVRITKDKPWSLFVYDELHTVIAGLNSTMAETHRDGEHYGHVGEDQWRWFRDQLVPYRRKGWLRIAAVHHNALRDATKDDSNLRDASDIDYLLANEINLMLHGHTHDGKLGRLPSDVPVVSTGSLGVKGEARPHGVPRQYQVVSVRRDALHRWTRAYYEPRRAFVGDVSASLLGNDWRHQHSVPFTNLGAFAAPPRDDEPNGTRPDEPGDVAPLQTAIVLDRTNAWEDLTTRMAAAPSHAVFTVYGTWHQDINLFMMRIQSYFNAQAAATHSVVTVDPAQDGSRPTAAEDWVRATSNATRSGSNGLATVLRRQAHASPLLLLLSDRGPVRAESRGEQDALVEFLVSHLPKALRPEPPSKPPACPVRVVVPIELPEDGSTELVTRIHRGVQNAGLELFHHELTLPKWPDIETSLRYHANHLRVALTDEQLERCRVHYEEILASLRGPDKRMKFLGNKLDGLFNELLDEAMLRNDAPRS